MPQYVLIVEYDGSRFHGFQRQHSQRNNHNHNDNNSTNTVFSVMKKKPRLDSTTGLRKPLDNEISIQDCLESAILQWLMVSNSSPQQQKQEQEEVGWSLDQLMFRFAGRTDKGVHARGQVVTVQLPSLEDNNNVPSSTWKIQKAINSRLPVDISISSVFKMEPGREIDPRADAKHKQYSYSIKFQRRNIMSNASHSSDKQQENPTMLGVGARAFRHALDDSSCLWSCPWALDDSILKDVCHQLQGTHDYSAFVHKDDRDKKDNTLTVSRFDFDMIQVMTPPSEHSLYYVTNDDSIATGESKDDGGGDCTREQPVIILGKFVVESKGFRRTMVRNLVGFVVDICRGAQSQNEIESIWTGTKEAAAKVKAAPASGLCLEYVKY